jgi:hypothetical protein
MYQVSDKKYLVWDIESGWRITDAAGIAKYIEQSYYSGYGYPTKFFELDDERGEMCSVSLAHLRTTEDSEDYQYSDYRIGEGKDAEHFTVRIDGRA